MARAPPHLLVPSCQPLEVVRHLAHEGEGAGVALDVHASHVGAANDGEGY